MHRLLNLTLPVTRYSTALAGMVAAIGIATYWANVSGLQINSASEVDNSPRTVAWYVAHIIEAKAINRTCVHSQERSSVPAATEDCRNALRALELAHVGSNYQN